MTAHSKLAWEGNENHRGFDLILPLRIWIRKHIKCLTVESNQAPARLSIEWRATFYDFDAQQIKRQSNADWEMQH